MNYDEEMLREINDNIDLVSYVEQTMELRKKGDKYFAHCPLHEDKTPSLCFNPSENYFHCFSCGKSGKMIGFLMAFEKLPFQEAVNKAAKIANVDVSNMCRSDTMIFLKHWSNIKRLKDNQSPYNHPILPKDTMNKYSKEPISEWINEGIDQNILDMFGVRIDDISNRIVYPVYDINGNQINVKGRTRYKNYKRLKIAKYINYYPVGKVDYFQSLEKTLPYVREQNEIIIFESVKSVMKAYGWGYKNCASAEKHTLTPEQISLLVKLRVNVVFAYDTDVNYKEKEVELNIDKLRKLTNVYTIYNEKSLIGNEETRNAPVDCGREVWEELYTNYKRKVV